MKVLFLARSDIFTVKGGDTVQIENTAKELGGIGVEVDVATCPKVDFVKYDIVHVFQLDWVPETYFYVKKAKDAGKPIVLSPIHHAEYEVKRFDDIYTFGLRKVVGMVVKKQEHRDILKNLYRSLFDRSKFIPTLKGLVFGYRYSQKRALELCDIVVVQTNKEAEDLAKTYAVQFQWVKIVNGVSEEFYTTTTFVDKLAVGDYVICVGRIEARKNQLKIIEAVKLLRQEKGFQKYNLVFIGKLSNHHKSYVEKFAAELRNNPWIQHPGFIPQELIPSYFHFAKAGVSASWFETTGLTSLEALFCGTNVVAAGDRARELLGDFAEYCDPADSVSIKEAIGRACLKPRPVIPHSFQTEYSWKSSAAKLTEVYNQVLKVHK
ncbi:TPA: hypothetical protein DCY43_01740 [candidate division WWE3 bacterium]|uniref:Glycosyl transferase group 1 n=2 Tax=Katanobacteria TaxID=422282 RepID=A0A0G1KMC4_UNCKA|nr:MAG: Glycosyl transferase group 1 [candidate division WWE3 bacterium GW2011_GWC2_44_9]HAZ29460.1 hypothetical protein [candidate division WWE3 bacterium]